MPYQNILLNKTACRFSMHTWMMVFSRKGRREHQSIKERTSCTAFPLCFKTFSTLVNTHSLTHSLTHLFLSSFAFPEQKTVQNATTATTTHSAHTHELNTKQTAMFIRVSSAARLPGYQATRLPGCQAARLPGCQAVNMPN